MMKKISAWFLLFFNKNSSLMRAAKLTQDFQTTHEVEDAGAGRNRPLWSGAYSTLMFLLYRKGASNNSTFFIILVTVAYRALIGCETAFPFETSKRAFVFAISDCFKIQRNLVVIQPKKETKCHDSRLLPRIRPRSRAATFHSLPVDWRENSRERRAHPARRSGRDRAFGRRRNIPHNSVNITEKKRSKHHRWLQLMFSFSTILIFSLPDLHETCQSVSIHRAFYSNLLSPVHWATCSIPFRDACRTNPHPRNVHRHQRRDRSASAGLYAHLAERRCTVEEPNHRKRAFRGSAERAGLWPKNAGHYQQDIYH